MTTEQGSTVRETATELARCPECGEVADVLDRDVWESTGGPVEHIRVRCLARHWFLLPVEHLERALRAQGASTTRRSAATAPTRSRA